MANPLHVYLSCPLRSPFSEYPAHAGRITAPSYRLHGLSGQIEDVIIGPTAKCCHTFALRDPSNLLSAAISACDPPNIRHQGGALLPFFSGGPLTSIHRFGTCLEPEVVFSPDPEIFLSRVYK